MTHVTKFNEENFLTGRFPVRSFHNGFDTVRCANQRNVRATVSKQANSHHAESHLWRFPSLSGQGFPCRGRRGSRCHYRSPRPDGIRTTAQFHQLARHCTTCHRDNFYWQREFTQNINLLGSVCNTDKFFCNRSNDFSRVSAAPPPLIICMWPLISSAPST